MENTHQQKPNPKYLPRGNPDLPAEPNKCVTCGSVTDRWQCPKCEREQQAKEHAARMKARFLKMCPPLYQETDVARLPNPGAHERVMAWRYGAKGLIAAGPTGLGKSRSVWLLVHRLMTVDLIDLRFLDCIRFGHELLKRFKSDDDEVTPWLDGLAEVPVLFLDDLGKDRLTERTEMELFGVIERRCANRLPILATTNDNPQSLAERMSDNRGPALIRRLREFCDVVQF